MQAGTRVYHGTGLLCISRASGLPQAWRARPARRTA